MSLAIIPGSFDPMTLGHLDVIADAARRYDDVVVAVMINPAKKYCFDMKARVTIARKTVAAYPNVRVIADRGMLIDLFDKLGADVVCKGWRDARDYEYEQRMAEWNRAHNPRFRTELIQAREGHELISSTEVRDLIARGEPLDAYVHADAIPVIQRYIEQ